MTDSKMTDSKMTEDSKLVLEILEETLIINSHIGTSASGKYVQHMGGEARERAIIQILTEIKITKLKAQLDNNNNS